MIGAMLIVAIAVAGFLVMFGAREKAKKLLTLVFAVAVIGPIAYVFAVQMFAQLNVDATAAQVGAVVLVFVVLGAARYWLTHLDLFPARREKETPSKPKTRVEVPALPRDGAAEESR